MEALKQGRYQPLEDWKQALLLFAVSEGFADHVEVSKLYRFERALFPFFEEQYPALVERLKTGAKADAALLEGLRAALRGYNERS